jgi:hypothetical protein
MVYPLFSLRHRDKVFFLEAAINSFCVNAGQTPMNLLYDRRYTKFVITYAWNAKKIRGATQHGALQAVHQNNANNSTGSGSTATFQFCLETFTRRGPTYSLEQPNPLCNIEIDTFLRPVLATQESLTCWNSIPGSGRGLSQHGIL